MIEKNLLEKIKTVLLIAVVVIVAFNTVQMSKMDTMAAEVMGEAESAETEETSSGTETVAVGPDVIPTGVPAVYGEELGISFDDVSSATPQKADATLRKLAVLDSEITLSGAELQRYIDIASQISCEYCCGAPSVITSTGDAACGCAHSAAMRGVAKYLISQHGDEYTDDEVLEEMGKWKTLSFPGLITAKAKILEEKGIELNYINLASNKYRGIEAEAESDSGSGMVGGC